MFSMTLIVKLFAIVRFSLNSPSSPPLGPIWIQVWSTAEQSVSIANALGASFRSFVLQKIHASVKTFGGRWDDSYTSSRKH